MRQRLAAAATLCAALLLAACTQQAPQPPPPTSGPTMPSDPATSATPTPSVTPNTQEHADLLEIQSLYKAEFAAETNVLKHGGANKLPADIRKRTTGTYQLEVLGDFQATKKSGERLAVGGTLLGIAMGQWTPTKVEFQSCEDYSDVKLVNRQGKRVNQGPGARLVQRFVVVKKGGSWLFSSVKQTVVKGFQSSPCNGTWYS